MVYGALKGFMHNTFWQDIAPSSDVDTQSKLSAPVDRGESFNPFKVNISCSTFIFHCIELNNNNSFARELMSSNKCYISFVFCSIAERLVY